MKFHCDRCKTRYSIADDRVKGKVLKIRCKNCSAVITVKEGQGDPDDVAVGTPAATPAVKKPTPAATPAPRATGSTGKAPAIPGDARPARGRTTGPSAAVGAARVTSPSGRISAQIIAQEAAPAAAVASPASRPSPAAPPSIDEPATDTSAPTNLEAEWYVSIDGQQSGPFSLRQAQDWVSARAVDDELHCWSEGFDDWLPVEKVSHFRGLRRGSAAATQASTARPALRPGSDSGDATMVDGPSFARPASARPTPPSAPQDEDTPRPLFARALARVTAEAPTQIEGDEPPDPLARPARPNGAGAPPMPADAGAPPAAGDAKAARTALVEATGASDDEPPADDFQIGEASRVVNLSMLVPRAPTSSGATGANPRLPGLGGTAGLPALGRGTGAEPRLGSTAALASLGAATAPAELPPPAPPRSWARRHRLALALGTIGVVAVGAIVAVLVLSSGSGDGGDQVARGKGADDSLAFQYLEEARKGGPATEVATTRVETGGGKRVIRRPQGGTGGGTGPAIIPTAGDDEVSLGTREEAARPLDGNDLLAVQQKNQAGLQMCFTRALKRDPYLKVPKAMVSIQVGLSGQVSSVSIPALAGTELGTCIEGFIKRWKFPKTTEVFSGQFPVVFSAR